AGLRSGSSAAARLPHVLHPLLHGRLGLRPSFGDLSIDLALVEGLFGGTTAAGVAEQAQSEGQGDTSGSEKAQHEAQSHRILPRTPGGQRPDDVDERRRAFRILLPRWPSKNVSADSTFFVRNLTSGPGAVPIGRRVRSAADGRGRPGTASR